MRVLALSLVSVVMAAVMFMGCDAIDSTEGISQDGADVTGPQLEDTPCQDDTECSGLLEPGGCYVAVCDGSVKACAAIPMPNGTACSDSSGCGVAEGVCDGGVCLSDATADCNDHDPCTEDICTAEFGCVYKDLEEGAPCDDGEACSLDDACMAGVCQGILDKESADCEGKNICGDGVCQAGENCNSCESDCGECTGDTVCGDGKCEELETMTCPEDCQTPPKPFCGDDECSQDESPESCPQDCSGEEPPQVEDLIECLTVECGGEFFACLSDPVCSESLECMGSCGSDTACLQGCIDFGAGFSGAQIALVQCAAGSGCMDVGGGGGGGGPGSGPECGDGQCEDGENQESCPEDCGGDQFGCGDGTCEVWEQWTCPADCEEPGGSECGNGECEEGENEDNCPADCDNGGGGGQQGCGDGTCEVWEQWTCPEDCEEPGGSECGNGECEEGENEDNCPADCDNGGGGGQQGCGDGTCEVWEQWTCPEDCEEPGGSECGNGECEEGENEDNCPADCDNGGGGGQQGCGDGTCEVWEQWTCPEDCEDPEPECGNDKCEEGEGPETCPEDCKKEEVECGNGACEKGENQESCPADCSDDPPPTEDTLECLTQQCELGSCLDYPVCTESFDCMAACSDSECAQECIADLSGPAKNVLEGVLECGAEEACW